VFYYKKKIRPAARAALDNSADAPIPTLWNVLNVLISAQPTATLRHQSVHNEESCNICHLGPYHLRACSRFQEMDPESRRQATIQVGACTNCLSAAHKN